MILSPSSISYLYALYSGELTMPPRRAAQDLERPLFQHFKAGLEVSTPSSSSLAQWLMVDCFRL
jgi:hypothetical protein